MKTKIQRENHLFYKNEQKYRKRNEILCGLMDINK